MKIIIDSNYIIQRLKLTPYKPYTVQLLRMQLENIDKFHRQLLFSDLKTELNANDNLDIYQQICELIGIEFIAA